MKFLRTKYKQGEGDNRVFLGAFVPEEDLSYLAIYSYAKRETKSKLIRDALAAKVRALKIQYPEDILETELIQRLQVSWKIYCDKNKETIMNLMDFKEMVAVELKKAGVMKDRIKDILQKL